MAEAPAAPGSGAIRIGEWLLVPSTHSLERDGQVRRLPRQLVELLGLLASRPGETFAREALLQQVWARKVVNDEVLSRAIADLRAQLGDDARAPRYIETLPKTGYRLIAPVLAIAGDPLPIQGLESSGDGGATPQDIAPSRPRPVPAFWWSALLLLALAAAGAWWLHARLSDQAAERAASATDAGWTAERMLHEQPFRSGPDWAHHPRFSRDGRWLAFVVTSLEGDGTTLWWSAADGSAPRRVDGGPGRLGTPVFSPDGTALAFTAREDGGCQVRVVALPAGAPRDIAPCAGAAASGLDWPSPGRLLHSGPPVAAGRGVALWQVDPRSGERRVLTDPPATAVADSDPRTSADGRIAFLRGPDGLRELWLWQDGTQRQLTRGTDRVPGLAWTPDAGALVVASDRTGFPALHRVDAATGEMRLLGGRGAATLDVGPDGRLLYEQRRYDANLWVYAGGAEPRQLTDSTRYEAYAALSGEGQRVLYVSNRDGNGSIWLQGLAGGNEQRLALAPAEAWVRPQWLDARQVLLTRYATGGGTHIEVFDLARQSVLPEHPLRGPGFAGVPLEDGRLLLALGHGEASGMRLAIRAAGVDRPLAGATGVAEFRSDGRWIGWTRRGDPRLNLVDTGSAGAPAASVDLGDVRGWTLHAGTLVTVRRDADGWALWRQALPDGVPQRRHAVRAPPVDGQVVLAPGGETVLLSHLDAFAADLLLVPSP